MDNNKKFIVTFNPSQPVERPLLSEYNHIVKISYGNVPLNVTSPIGHHITTALPKECTYQRNK